MEWAYVEKPKAGHAMEMVDAKGGYMVSLVRPSPLGGDLHLSVKG